MQEPKGTVMHYHSYNDSDVLENAEELCASCHARVGGTSECRRKHSNIIRKSWQVGVYKDRKRNWRRQIDVAFDP